MRDLSQGPVLPMRNEDPFLELVGDRRSRRIDYRDGSIVSRVDGNFNSEGFYERMFVEDLSRLLPYGRGLSAPIDVKLESSDADVKDMLLNALPVTYRPAQFLSDGIRDFAATIVRSLAGGPVTIEVEMFAEKDGRRARAFNLHPLPSALVGRRRGSPIQWVSPDQSTRKFRGSPFVELDSSRLVQLDFSRSTRAAMKKAFAALGAASELQFVPSDMITNPERNSANFDFEAYRRIVDETTLKQTRAVGWDGRRLFTQDALEPYWIWRNIQFSRLKLLARDSILDGLNRALVVAGTHIGFNAQLKLERVLTIAHLDEAEESLRIGDKPLVDLVRLEPDDILESPPSRGPDGGLPHPDSEDG